MPFSNFGLQADVLRGVSELGFKEATPIQNMAIGPAMEGKDVMACAATGSGKTAAFLLPVLHRLKTKAAVPAPGGVKRARVLVLTPTRELAVQILDNLKVLAKYAGVTGAAIIGGMSMGPQVRGFGADILVATPGRLLDHMRRPYARVDGIEILVLDEADRMLDMGFLPDIRRIVGALPVSRQTLFFSATMPQEIRQLMNSMLRNPVAIQIERQAAPAAAITQAIYPVPQHLKTALLCKLLEGEGLESVICFTRTKHRANRLALALKGKGISCVPIHGNRSQGQRTAALAGFKAGEFRVLVATDIAARGIDVEEVSHVVNFDCPHVAEDYIHRVGRTGRASAVGDAFTFVSEEEQGNLRVIERALGKRLPQVRLPDFDYGQKATERLEVPIAERIAAIRAEKARARSRQQGGGQGHGHAPRSHDGKSGGQQGGNTGGRKFFGGPGGGGGGGGKPGGGRGPTFRHKQLPGKGGGNNSGGGGGRR